MERTKAEIGLTTMQREDLPPVLELINEEGWEYELVDVERILEVDSRNSVVATAGKEVVGGVTVACHKNRGVLGHVVVKKGWRKAGIGKKMMVEVLRRLDEGCIGIVELYSVPDALEFYKRLGFRKIGDLRIYKGSIENPPAVKTSGEIRNLTRKDLMSVVEMDRRISGFDRSNVIEKLMLPYLRSCYGLFKDDKLKGFALGRNAAVESEIGPWIMEEPNRDDGAALIMAVMKSINNMKTFIEIPGENPLSNSIIQELGFETKFEVFRCVRTKFEIEKFGSGVMAYSALEFG